MNRAIPGEYGRDHHPVDFILGITYEIWESKGLDLIREYYHSDVEVFTPDGVSHGVEPVVQSSLAMLNAFPDRALVGDQVIWCEENNADFYSSHRILSPMTNLGDSVFGPATGRRIQIFTIADCLVRDGVVVREWLVRDNLALVRQLGFDPLEAAKRVSRRGEAHCRTRLAGEIERLRGEKSREPSQPDQSLGLTRDQPGELAWHLLGNLWSPEASRLQSLTETAYAPYVVLHRSPVELYSGRAPLLAHYGSLRAAFGSRHLSLDHVAWVPFGSDGLDLAARWTMACEHTGPYAGADACGKTLYVLGISHWRIHRDKVISEWTLMDPLALLAQILD